MYAAECTSIQYRPYSVQYKPCSCPCSIVQNPSPPYKPAKHHPTARLGACRPRAWRRSLCSRLDVLGGKSERRGSGKYLHPPCPTTRVCSHSPAPLFFQPTLFLPPFILPPTTVLRTARLGCWVLSFICSCFNSLSLHSYHVSLFLLYSTYSCLSTTPPCPQSSGIRARAGSISHSQLEAVHHLPKLSSPLAYRACRAYPHRQLLRSLVA